MRRKKSTINGEDLIRKESQKICNLHQDMKDIIVKLFTQAFFKIGKGGFTGYIGIVDTGIQSKMLSPIPVLEDFQKGFHVGVFFKVTEELAEKKADRVIGKTRRGIFVGDNGTDKREICQGGDKTG